MQAFKILIFSGLKSNSLLIHQFKQSCLDLGLDCDTVHRNQLKRKSFYNIRKRIFKLFKKKSNYGYVPLIAEANIIKTLKARQPDIVLVIGFSYPLIEPHKLAKLKKKLGFQLCLWDTDMGHMFRNPTKLIFFIKNELPIYDHIFSFSKQITRFLRGKNFHNTTQLPFGANEIKTTSISKQKKYDICFIGSPDMRRLFLLEQLSDKNIIIFGKSWQKMMPLMSDQLCQKIDFSDIWDEELYQTMCDSKIILNITASDCYANETGINLRVFEVLAAGGFLLTDYYDELDDLFNIGKEIAIYQSAKELRQQVDYYLQHEQERETIAVEGHKAFLAKHTFKQRAKELLNVIL